MHEIEPFYNWLDYYNSEEDERSPFYGTEHIEFEFSNTIYNFYVHPQWDSFGAENLYIKILYADYAKHFMVIEMIGEWNDCITNDIMTFKRDFIDPFIEHDIYKFVLIGENVLNFHYSDDCYYEEWYEDIRDNGGWIAALNFREHVLEEMRKAGIHHYVLMNDADNEILWRNQKPFTFHKLIEENLMPRLLP